MSSQEVINVICHEAAHARQYRLCEAYDSLDSSAQSLPCFNNVQLYRYEENNYIDGDADDYYMYYMQAIEIDSRRYAEIEGNMLYSQICDL